MFLCVFDVVAPASTESECSTLFVECALRMHHGFDVPGGIAVFLTNWCFCVFCAAAPASTVGKCTFFAECTLRMHHA